MRTAVIVPAAGIGRRMQSATEKQFLLLSGEPVIVHTLRTLAQHPQVEEICLVVPADKIKICREDIVAGYRLDKITKIVAGGRQRQDSVSNGLDALTDNVDLVLVHDGVRPLVSQNTISRVIGAAKKSGAAVAALPVKETIKEVGPTGAVIRTLERESLYSVQTPQGFRREILARALRQAAMDNFYGTDEAMLVERLGLKVVVVEGNPENVKLTIPEDLIVAEALLKGRI